MDLVAFRTVEEAEILQTELYTDCIANVEELAVLEYSPASKNFHGWFNREEPREYLLVSENQDGTKTVFFQPFSEEWKDFPWIDLLDGKLYIQTNLLGLQILQNAESRIFVPHVIRYFRFEAQKLLGDFQKADLG
ncbi:MAG: hypothetical protein ACFFD4_40760, partial [Candidatus Odinarchaeota archaeon]